MESLRIDIVSDIVCPWCVIGFKRLENVLEQYKGDVSVDIHWQPFELNPDMVSEGQNLREHLQEKYGSTPQQSSMIRERIISLGAELGFDFQFHDEMRIYNTFKAHQLLFWAETLGKQTELKQELFKQYFSQRQDISSHQVLLKAVNNVGLDSSIAAIILEEDHYSGEVREQESFWQKQGIHSVPAIIFNQQHLVSGAQDESVFANYFKQMLP